MHLRVAELLGTEGEGANGNGNGKGKIAPLPANNGNASGGIENIQRIWTILQETPGFQPMHLLQAIPDLLSRQEVRDMGRDVASSLAQRAIARLVRDFVTSPEESDAAVPFPNSSISLDP